MLVLFLKDSEDWNENKLFTGSGYLEIVQSSRRVCLPIRTFIAPCFLQIIMEQYVTADSFSGTTTIKSSIQRLIKTAYFVVTSVMSKGLTKIIPV